MHLTLVMVQSRICSAIYYEVQCSICFIGTDCIEKLVIIAKLILTDVSQFLDYLLHLLLFGNMFLNYSYYETHFSSFFIQGPIFEQGPDRTNSSINWKYDETSELVPKK